MKLLLPLCLLALIGGISATAWIMTMYFVDHGTSMFWTSPDGEDSHGWAFCNAINSLKDPRRYGTISAAARCAQAAGDIVNIKPGTYTHETYSIPHSPIAQ